jgi:lysophospholipase L1-like esterase
MRSRWRGSATVMAAICALLIGAQPAAAAPGGGGQSGGGQSGGDRSDRSGITRMSGPATSDPRTPAPVAASRDGWHPQPKIPAPRTIPGLGTRVAPFTTSRKPIAPKALNGSEAGKANSLLPGTKARAVKPSELKKVAAADPEGTEEPGGNYYCQPFISGQVGVGEQANTGPYSDTLFTAELACNFYLDYAYVVAGVVDRSNGYDNTLLWVGSEYGAYGTAYGASSGGVRISGDLYDGARALEVISEMYLVAPGAWSSCNPIPGLRYLACDGLGTNTLHIVVGTGAYGSGLNPPVLRYVALGDSYSAGTGASSYLGAPNPPECRRSSQTYSYRLAGGRLPLGNRGETLPIDQPNLKACNAARISMLRVGQTSEPPQVTYLNPYRTRLVTLTIGGNDLEFGAKFRACSLGTCSAPLVTPTELETTRARLTELYVQIRSSMRQDGKLVVLSYPAVVPNPDDLSVDHEATNGRCPVVNQLITTDEQRAIYQATVQARNMVRDAVAATGDSHVVFVDQIGTFRGHRLCADDEWANGYSLDVPEVFHPNDRGYLAMALQTITQVGIGAI